MKSHCPAALRSTSGLPGRACAVAGPVTNSTSARAQAAIPRPTLGLRCARSIEPLYSLLLARILSNGVEGEAAPAAIPTNLFCQEAIRPVLATSRLARLPRGWWERCRPPDQSTRNRDGYSGGSLRTRFRALIRTAAGLVGTCVS